MVIYSSREVIKRLFERYLKIGKFKCDIRIGNIFSANIEVESLEYLERKAEENEKTKEVLQVTTPTTEIVEAK